MYSVGEFAKKVGKSVKTLRKSPNMHLAHKIRLYPSLFVQVVERKQWKSLG